MPNLDAMEHRWVATLASFEFTLKYQKRPDNRVADAVESVSPSILFVRERYRFNVSMSQSPKSFIVAA